MNKKQNMGNLFFIIKYSFVFVPACLISYGNAQDTIRVPADVAKIQDALDIATTNTIILVAPGIYYENLNWPSDTDGISLIGTGGSTQTIIDGSNAGRVINIEATNPGGGNNLISQTTLLKGLTIQHGKTESSDGAGLRCFYANPRLEDLRFVENEGAGNGCVGAGAYLFGYSGIIVNCVFVRNRITATTTTNGTGLAVVYVGNVTISDCTFLNNMAVTGKNSFGTGLILTKTSNSPLVPVSILIDNCRFEQNINHSSNISHGGGMYVRGNITDDQTTLNIENCIFYRNEAKNSGGAIYVQVKNVDVKNCIFNQNEAEDSGGAFYADVKNFDQQKSILIKNKAKSGGGMYFSRADLVNIKTSRCTQNESMSGSGIFLNDVGSFGIHSCRFDHNRSLPNTVVKGSAIYYKSDDNNTKLNQIVFDHNAENPVYFERPHYVYVTFCTSFLNEKSTFEGEVTASVDNSILWNLSEKESSGPNIDLSAGLSLVKGVQPQEGSILNENPLMVSDDIPVPSLQSPCIDFGDDWLLEIEEDIQGYPRILPVGSWADIGAYEVDQYNAFVSVRYFFDQNQNGVKENDEPWLQFGMATDNKGKTYVNTSMEGLKVFLRTGNQKVSFVGDGFSDWQLTNQKDHTFFVNSEEFQAAISFGLSPLKIQNDVFSFMASDPLRCGERGRFVVAATNAGTTKSDGQLKLRLDNKIDDITFGDMPDVTISDQEYVWNYTGLAPGEVFAKTFFVTSPDEIIPGQTDTMYSFCHHISGLTDTEPVCYQTTLHCADVGEKKVATPQREDKQHLVDRPLIYTIRFQNTGFDFVRNVFIVDDIDTSFDITSLKVLGASHEDVLSVTYDEVSRRVTFEFKNIFLQDTFSRPEENRGFVTYSIQNKKQVPLQTEVKNTALVRFDNFSPVTTNTTINILVDRLPTFTTGETMPLIRIYPNPTSDRMFFSQIVEKVSFYTLAGQHIKQFESTDQVVVDLPAGTYVLNLLSQGRTETYKVIVVK